MSTPISTNNSIDSSSLSGSDSAISLQLAQAQETIDDYRKGFEMAKEHIKIWKTFFNVHVPSEIKLRMPLPPKDFNYTPNTSFEMIGNGSASK